MNWLGKAQYTVNVIFISFMRKLTWEPKSSIFFTITHSSCDYSFFFVTEFKSSNCSTNSAVKSQQKTSSFESSFFSGIWQQGQMWVHGSRNIRGNQKKSEPFRKNTVTEENVRRIPDKALWTAKHLLLYVVSKDNEKFSSFSSDAWSSTSSNFHFIWNVTYSNGNYNHCTLVFIIIVGKVINLLLLHKNVCPYGCLI